MLGVLWVISPRQGCALIFNQLGDVNENESKGKSHFSLTLVLEIPKTVGCVSRSLQTRSLMGV